jgi:hypothetical protein
MTKRLGALAGLALAASIVVGCAGDDASSDDPAGKGGTSPNGESKPGDKPVKLGPDGLPVSDDGKPLAPKLDGKYELSSEFDLTTSGLLPNVMSDTLKALSNFKEQPSQTIVDLADAANVPVIPTIINAIPSPIRGFFLGYIDDHIFKALYNAVPVTKRITEILDDMASIVTHFQVITTLDLPPGDATGDATASHVLTGMGYMWGSKQHVITLPELVGKLTSQKVEANAVLLETRAPDLESARLKLSKHTFSVPIGSFAVGAIDALAKDKFGVENMRAAIGKVIDCDKLAADIANRCIDPIGPGKICIDHEKEIKQFCSVGLDLIVGALRGSIKNLDIPALELSEGFAQMWDAPATGGPLDATIDRIEGGFWNTTMRLAKNPVPMVSQFRGKRVGESSFALGGDPQPPTTTTK